MKVPGIIGGIGPESTIDYYRAILAAYQARVRDGSNPTLLIRSIDTKRMVDGFIENRLADVTDYLVENIEHLARGGADFGALSANTPHALFEDLVRRSPIPLLSIVEAACQEVVRLGLRRPALIGTRFTMTGRFYREVFHRAGLSITVPGPEEQELIHGAYLNEWIKGVFQSEARDHVLGIIRRMRDDEQIDSVILGGTELPILLRDGSVAGVRFLDTAQIHAERIVEEILS